MEAIMIEYTSDTPANSCNAAPDDEADWFYYAESASINTSLQDATEMNMQYLYNGRPYLPLM